MNRYILTALIESLNAFANAGASGPTEIALPTRDFLWLAGDLNIDDPNGRSRIAYAPATPPTFNGPTVASKTHQLLEVRVGSSFVFNGPLGPVVVREVPS